MERPCSQNLSLIIYRTGSCIKMRFEVNITRDVVSDASLFVSEDILVK